MTERLILVGAGLANGLLAYRLSRLRPALELTLLERDDRCGGSHTWSFHANDLAPSQQDWIAPFVAHDWPSHEVRFPAYARRLDSGYRSVTSARLHAVLADTLGARLRTGVSVRALRPDAVQLDDGRWLEADAVIDARGPGPMPHLALAWQKFVGLEVRTRAPHGLAAPILMDATVAQLDGFRFVYVLPLSADTLLIEDTYYSDEPALDAALLQARIAEYAAARGWAIERVLREESGVLPIALDGDPAGFWRDGGAPGVPRAGLRAALFHPTTGYSLPDAVQLADRLAQLPRLNAAALHRAIREQSLAAWRARGFYRLLNRMLFRAATPTERRAVMQRFYRLREPLIRRFYAGRSTPLDKLRVLVGRPPVPMGRAILAALRPVPPSPVTAAAGERTA